MHLQSVIMALLCITVCNDALFTHSLFIVWMTLCYIHSNTVRNDAVFAYSLCIAWVTLWYIDTDTARNDAIFAYSLCIHCMSECYIDTDTEHNDNDIWKYEKYTFWIKPTPKTLKFSLFKLVFVCLLLITLNMSTADGKVLQVLHRYRYEA